MAEINLGNDNELNIDLSPVETLTTTVPDINYIPGYKEAEEERRENEAIRISNEETRQENETARQNYYTYIQGKVDNGDFDGVSPIVTTSKSGDTTTITIVDAEGTKTATILDGTAYYGVVSDKPTIDGVTNKIKIVATADEFTLEKGATIVINFKFSGYATPLSSYGYQLNVNNTGFKNIYWGNTLTPPQGENTGFYKIGQTLSFVYDGSNYRAIDCRFGDTTTYGIVKLSDSTGLNDSGLAATSKAVKSAYDKATSVESSLSNYVLKTDYSTYSTAGVVKSGINGFQVDSSGNPKAFNGSYANYTAATNDLFIGKGTLENVITGKDLTTKSYVDDSVEPINDYVFGEESVSGEGTSIQMTDTLKGKLKSVECKGQISQTGTPTPASPIPINVVSGDNTINICGKNLFDKNNVFVGYLKDDGTLSTDIAYKTSDFIPIQPNTAYYKTNTASPRTKYYDSNKQPLNTTTYQDISIGGNAGTFTTPNNAYYLRFSFPVTGGTAVNIDTIMLHKGTTALPYEPYIGNSYPLYLGVENLIEDNKINLNSGLSDSGVIFLNAPTRTTIYKVPVLPNLTYTVSCANGYQIGNIFNYNSSETWTNTTTFAYSTSHTFTNSSTTYFISFVMRRDDNGNMTSSDLPLLKVQLEKGSKANSYSEYGTTPIELCKIGTYQDYIYKDNGSWYLHKEIGKVVLNGMESNWTTQTHTGFYRYGLTINDMNNVSSLASEILIKSAGFRGISFNNRNSDTSETIYVVSNGQQHGFFVNTQFTSITNFKTWLSTHNTIVYYVLATPTNTEITDTLLLEQLEALSSEKGITNISQTNNDLPMILDVEAFKNTLNGKLGLLDKLVEG